VKKKPNPNDATFRNITALKKRVEKLERQLQVLGAAARTLGRVRRRG
jgi:hypothetical protein